MQKLSVLIPARNEPYLTKTVHDIFAKASTRDVEVLVTLENFWPPDWDSVSEQYPGRLITIHRGRALGMRDALNRMAAIARGDVLMKTDAHCLFSPNFDRVLMDSCGSKTVVIPRRYRLNAEAWTVIDDGRSPVDYEYLSAPDDNGGGLKGRIWEQRAKERLRHEVDENMIFQGSCWLMPRSYFYELDLMDENNYGTFWKEAIEIACKAWLSGGRVVTNKVAHYAHLHKNSRGYSMPSEEQIKAHEFSKKWLDDSTGWAKQTRPFRSLIQQFNPPGWPAEYYRK